MAVAQRKSARPAAARAYKKNRNDGMQSDCTLLQLSSILQESQAEDWECASRHRSIDSCTIVSGPDNDLQQAVPTRCKDPQSGKIFGFTPKLTYWSLAGYNGIC